MLPPGQGGEAGIVAALRERRFRWLFAGQSVSAIGDQVFVVAIAALVIEAGYGAGGLGLVLAGRTAAMVLFMVFGGVAGDRFSRTALMRGADALRAVAVAGLALAPGEVPLGCSSGSRS